jgi:hypothetical protein
MEQVGRLVLVEGLPGSGKTTTGRLIEDWTRTRNLPAQYFGEGRADHPVDFEEVAVVSDADILQIGREFPVEADSLMKAAERRDGYWLVRERERVTWPEALRQVLRARDGYEGDLAPEVHRRALLDSWRRFADATITDPSIYVFECALIQNPVCSLLARFNQPAAAVEGHILDLASAVAVMDPLLVYLDAGDPERVLTAAAAERPAAWLDFVIRYHTEQGYGRAHGLRGFEGLVEFMRTRREFELRLFQHLPMRSHLIDVSRRDRHAHREEVTAALESTFRCDELQDLDVLDRNSVIRLNRRRQQAGPPTHSRPPTR